MKFGILRTSNKMSLGEQELARPARRFLALAGKRALGLDTAQAEAKLAKALEFTPADDPEGRSPAAPRPRATIGQATRVAAILLFTLIATAAVAGIAAPSAAAGRSYVVSAQVALPIATPTGQWKLSFYMRRWRSPRQPLGPLHTWNEIYISLDLDTMLDGGEAREFHGFSFHGEQLAPGRWSRRSISFDTGTRLGDFGRIKLALKSVRKPKPLPQPAPGCRSQVAVAAKLRGTFELATGMPYFGTLIRHSFPATLETSDCAGALPETSVETPPPPPPPGQGCPGHTHTIRGVTNDYEFEAFTDTSWGTESIVSDLHYGTYRLIGPATVWHSLSMHSMQGPYDQLEFNWSDPTHATITGFGPFSRQAMFAADGPPTPLTWDWLAGCGLAGTGTPGTWSGQSFVAHFLALGDVHPFAAPTAGTVEQLHPAP
jgi:hypothetical protein